MFVRLLLPALCWLALIARTSAADSLVIRDVSVLPMTGETVLPHRTVVVRDGIVSEIGPSTSAIPPDARVVDGTGLFLMPGLVDAHAHPASPGELVSFLLYGQTTIMTLAGEGLGEAVAPAGAAVPRVITSTTTLDGTPPTNRRFMSIADSADVGAVIDREIGRGAQFVKIYTRLDAERLCAIHRESRKRNLAVVGHIPRELPAATALKCLDMVAHGEEFFRYMGSPPTPAGIEAMAALSAREGVYVTPNIVAYKGMYRHVTALDADLRDPDAAYLSAASYQEWLPANNRYATRPNLAQFAQRVSQGIADLKRFTASLHAKNVPLLAGTDAPVTCLPGRCLIEEIALLHEAGLTAYEALSTATANAGRFARDRMHLSERFGVIEPGARADFILLGADPLASLEALNDLRAVVVGGLYRTKDDIAAARTALLPKLAHEHGRIDEYERLISAGDIKAVGRFLDAEPEDSRFLNLNVVIFDALLLEEDGRRKDAIALLSKAARLLPDGFGLQNELGRMRALEGDVQGARDAYRKALALAPLNGVARQGLAALP